MVKRSRKVWKDIFFGAFMIFISGVSTFLITTFISELRSMPQAVLVDAYDGRFCPNELMFSDSEGSLSFKLKNIGSDGKLFATLTVLESNKTQEFMLANHDEQIFKYPVKHTNTTPENFSASLSYGCSKRIFGMNFKCAEQKHCCSYSQKYPGFYKLVGVEC